MGDALRFKNYVVFFYQYTFNKIFSYDSFLNIGQVNEYDFVSIDFDWSGVLYDDNPIYVKFVFDVNGDLIEHERTIYSLLDLFGDIGGLYDTLRIMSELLLSFYLSVKMNKLMSNEVFSIQHQTNS